MDNSVLKQVMARKRVSRAELAQLSRLTLSTVNKLMDGSVKNPGVDTMLAIAQALGTTLDVLCNPYEDQREEEKEEWLEKYHRLDDHGKDTVNAVMLKLVECEFDRMLEG